VPDVLEAELLSLSGGVVAGVIYVGRLLGVGLCAMSGQGGHYGGGDGQDQQQQGPVGVNYLCGGEWAWLVPVDVVDPYA
jgi:hypothetical protein